MLTPEFYGAPWIPRISHEFIHRRTEFVPDSQRRVFSLRTKGPRMEDPAKGRKVKFGVNRLMEATATSVKYQVKPNPAYADM